MGDSDAVTEVRGEVRLSLEHGVDVLVPGTLEVHDDLSRFPNGTFLVGGGPVKDDAVFGQDINEGRELFFLHQEHHMVLFPGGRLRQFFLRRVPEDEVSDAFDRLGEPPLFQEHLPGLGLEFFFGPVDPAAAESHRVGRVHHVAESKAPVIEVGGRCSVCQHDDHHRSPVERVDARLAEDAGVHARQEVPGLRVSDGNKIAGLASQPAGGEQTGVEHLVEFCVGDHFRLKLADTAPFCHEFHKFVHGVLPF